MRPRRRVLRVDQTWDGQPARPGEVATLTLCPEADALVVEVDAPLHGDPAPPGPPGALWGLWEHEVVELFVAGAADAYTEVELGPHGHHLVVRFRALRQPWARELPLRWEIANRAGRWSGRAILPWSWLPDPPWRVNAYAIHGAGGARRYLAAHPPGGERPDFHRLDTFVPW